jgi:uncharacterized protein YigE (DUF2233 family)
MPAYVTAQDYVSQLHPSFRNSFKEKVAARIGVAAEHGEGAVLDAVLAELYDFAHDVRDELESN